MKVNNIKPSTGEADTNKRNVSRVSTGNALVFLIVIFVISIISLTYVYSMFPEVEESEKASIKLPRDIEDAKKLGNVLFRYKEKYFTEVLGGIFVTYIL